MTTPRPRSMPSFRVTALALLGVLAAGAPASAQDVISPGGLAAGTPALAAVPALVGQPLSFAGTVGGGGAGSRLQVQLRARGTSQWRTVATVVADGDGAFQASWISVVPGRFAVRGVPLGQAVAASVQAPLETVVTVYRAARRAGRESGSAHSNARADPRWIAEIAECVRVFLRRRACPRRTPCGRGVFAGLRSRRLFQRVRKLTR